MGAVEAQQERAGFYAVMAGLALTAALAGTAAVFFSTQIYLRAPFAVYGALAGAWGALVLWMARARRARRRADIGFAAAALAVAMAYVLPRSGVAMAQGGVAAELGGAAYSPFLSVFAGAALFMTCAAAAAFSQDRADAYRRFMLLAGAALLWPLWMRLSLDFPGAETAIRFAPVSADLAIAAAIVRDRIVLKTLHPAYARLGAVIAAAHVFEIAAYDSAPWRAAAQAVFSIFAG